MGKLENKRIAILTEEGFEQVELLSPKEALEKQGATVDIISPKTGEIKAWDKKEWGKTVTVDKQVSEARVDDYDALVLPGGVLNPDKLRTNEDAVQFTKDFMKSGKLVAAICHGPQTLIETGLLKGRTMTSYHSLQTDIKNAGANWKDLEAVQDGNLITSRNPGDLPAFNEKVITALSQVPEGV